MKWYTLQTKTLCENAVKKALTDRIKKNEMDHSFGEILVPVEKVSSLKKDGKMHVTEKSLYSSYIFVEMELNDDTWHLVKKTPNVMGFVGGVGNKPIPISDKEIQKMKDRMADTEHQPKHKIEYETGESIRIIDGPFKDFEGIVEQVDYNQSKLKVSVEVFGRPTKTEILFSQVQKSV